MAKELNFKQELTAAFGQPISENPTQVMIEAAYRHHALDWRYLTIEVAANGLGDAVQGARAMGFLGFNCTIPHKIAVIKHLDGLGESAELMQAVNCVVRRGDQLIGENTDGKGFVKAVRAVRDPSGSRVVVFGAGGAARAISVEMALAGASHITIVNRSPKRGDELLELLQTKVTQRTDGKLQSKLARWDQTFSIPDNTDIVVNATSIGLYPNLDARLNLDVKSLLPSMLIADVIPNPPRTNLIKDAEQRGCTVIDGLEMLVNQGVIGIEYWAGITPDARVMRAALEEVFR
ncbi:MAG: shikimate dehydrogenase [Planctomycetota bacterium]|nr:shikimate dehydrogenase [Planctomycetota bacterium]